MTSVFNPEEFLSQTHEAGFATKRPHLPEGEYVGQLLEGKDGMDLTTVQVDGEVRFILKMNWHLLQGLNGAANPSEVTGIDKPRVKQDIWLDLDSNGKLVKDKTHNVDLGRFLSGIGLNTDTFSFNQIRQVGLCKLKVAVDPDKKNPGNYYNRVQMATKYAG